MVADLIRYGLGFPDEGLGANMLLSGIDVGFLTANRHRGYSIFLSHRGKTSYMASSSTDTSI